MAAVASLQSTSFFFFFILTISFSSSKETAWAVHTNEGCSSSSSSSTSTSSLNQSCSQHHFHSSIRSFCQPTPYPDACFHSLKLSISIDINPNILTNLLKVLQTALSEAGKLTHLFSRADNNIIEKQRGAVQDCRELHEITVSSLQRSVSRIRSGSSQKLRDAIAFLSAALTNKNTCLEGLDSASGPLKPALVNSVIETYKHVSNSLSILSKQKHEKQQRLPQQQQHRSAKTDHHNQRHLLGLGRRGLPKWVSRKHGRVMEDDNNDNASGTVIWVAADGTGNFTTVTEAISHAPNNSYARRTFIYIKRGVYEENVEIPSHKPNMVLLGDGSDVTFITGNRSVMDGWTTFRSATLAVSGDGFLARDITIRNTAGPAKRQAVALRVNADMAAVYRCSIEGYQDTLYVHSFRQFYRECDIYGTIDFIFGNAVAVFQASNIVVRTPLRGQFTVVTAQSRDSEDEDTGISMQNCSIASAGEDLGGGPSYLGRPWRAYSRVVYIESDIGGFIDPAGWVEWDSSGEEEGNVLETLYYGEFDNSGLGSGTEGRVDWPGYHVMDYEDAANFSVTDFIAADEWLQSTSFPYDDSI